MTKYILFFSLLLITCITSGQPILRATIDNLPGGKAFLWNTSTTNKIDTVEIKNHSFTYTTSLAEPTLFYLKVDGYNNWDSPIRLILSSELTSMIFTELNTSQRSNSFSDVYPNRPKFPQDPNSNEQLHKFESLWLAFSDSIVKLSATSGDEKTLLPKRKQLYEDFIAAVHAFVTRNPDKTVTAVILYEYIIRNGLIQANEAKDLFLPLNNNVKFSAAGLKIGTYLDKEFSVKAGEAAPYFEFEDINSKKYDLGQFKNKRLLLHFWSSSCGPCRVENKALGKLNLQDIVVINISLDENEEQWKKAIAKDGLSNMINARDVTGKMKSDYNVHGIPVYYVIDENGRISNTGLDELKN